MLKTEPNQTSQKETLETVTVTLTVNVPAPYYKFLQALGQMVGKTPEQILTTETYCLLQTFIEGGTLEAWIESAIDHLTDRLGKLAEVATDLYAE